MLEMKLITSHATGMIQIDSQLVSAVYSVVNSLVNTLIAKSFFSFAC